MTTTHRPGNAPWGRPLANLLNVIWPFLLLISLWHAWIVIDEVPQLVALSPWLALKGMVSYFGELVPDMLATSAVIGTGLLAGMLMGVALASFAWFSPLLGGMLTPAVVLINAVPSVALIPIVASIFGFNTAAVVAIAALITFFPAFVLTRSGLDAVPPGSDDLFSVLGSSRHARFTHLALPAALPNVATALRIGAMLSVLGSLTAEWLLGTQGLGYRLALAQQIMDTELAWSICMLAIAFSLLVFGSATLLERYIASRFR
ncbi:ABC transporter permease [Pusillimonas sp.]|uniref:ABC transporter permease n=1 Tax=Pusillimonas sp. TaxID=3040095 RepID=UPI0037CAA8EF